MRGEHLTSILTGFCQAAGEGEGDSGQFARHGRNGCVLQSDCKQKEAWASVALRHVQLI